MSSDHPRTRLRPVRIGGPVLLGVDGLPCAPDVALAGIGEGSAAEAAEAGALVEAAQRHADELVRTALAEASTIRAAAHDAGYHAGYSEASSIARAELAEAMALVQRVAAEASAIRLDLMRRSEREMVEMVIAGIAAVLGDRAQSDADLATLTVRRALDRAGSQRLVRIRVHPDNATAVSAWLADADGDAPAFEVLPDGSISVGGCIIDTASGRVDARLDAQLDAIAQVLREAIPPEPMVSEDLARTGAADAA